MEFVARCSELGTQPEMHPIGDRWVQKHGGGFLVYLTTRVSPETLSLHNVHLPNHLGYTLLMRPFVGCHLPIKLIVSLLAAEQPFLQGICSVEIRPSLSFRNMRYVKVQI